MMCEYCKRITKPQEDIFIRSHAPGTKEEFRNPPECHFCAVCGRSIDGTQRAPHLPEWILVSERLPDVLGDYLVSDNFGHVHVMFCTPHLENPWGVSEHDARYFPVAAWMPLPLPYKEG